jgi:hypothetical protein
VFGATGGLSGGEVAVAGGTTVVGQRVLEAVFGDSAVRSLAARARADLGTRTGRLLGNERDRYVELVAAAAPEPGSGAALRAAAAELVRTRRAG